MYSGKSTELIRRVNMYRSIGMDVLVVNHDIDNRYSNLHEIVSHTGDRITGLKVSSLSELKTRKLPSIIAIDEAQFFKDLFDMVLYFVEQKNCKVIVSGLSGDFRRKPFGKILDLIPYSDNVWMSVAYCAVCKDGTKATFTARMDDNVKQVDVGNNYKAVCRKCYLR